MTKLVQFKVGMTCDGCKKAVTKILEKIEGVEGVEADVDAKKVDVKCNESVSAESMLEALKKWSQVSGKTVELVA